MASLVPLGYLFLFCAVASAFAVTDVIFENNEVDPMVAAMNKLLRAQAKIQHLNSAAIKNIGGNNLPGRLTILEEKIKTLNIPQPVDSSNGDALRKIQVQFSAMQAQLESLRTIVEKNAQQVEKQTIVQAVRNGYLKLAKEKLLGLSDFESQIQGIVHEVYACSEGNFGNLVDLAKALSNITASHEVLKSLFVEMQLTDNKDPYKVIVLAEAIQSEVLRQHNDPGGVKLSASVIIVELTNQIKTRVAEALIAGVRSNGRQNETRIRAIAAALNKYHPELCEEVMQHFVDAVHVTVDAEKILDYLFTQTTTTQAALGMKALFWKLNDSGKLDDKFQLKLASLLSKVKSRTEYAGLSQDQKNSMDKMIDRLPTCAKNLFFSPTVCLWNKDQEAYLEASTQLHDKDRRYLLVRPGKNNSSVEATPPAGAPWIVHEINDKILFKSSAYKNEYLYVAYVNPHDFANIKYVFGWVPGGNIDTQSAFDVELEGEYCYLRSSHFSEYMSVSDHYYRSAVTYSGGLPADKANVLWQIRKC